MKIMRRQALLVSSAIVFLVAVVALTFGFQNKRRDDTYNLESVVVQASWLPNGEFAFVCSAIVEGYYEEEGLDVQLRAGGPAISFARSSTILAQDKEVQLSLESVLTEFVEGRARANEVDQLRVKAVGAFWKDSPLGFLVQEDGPSSLEELFLGKRPDGSPWIIGATPDAVLIDAIAEYFGVVREDLEIVTTSYDATPFLAGQVDALWSFWTTQAYEAEVARVPYHFLPLSEVPGLAQPSMIVLAREDTLLEKKEMLAAWFRASLRGAEFTINNPTTAASYILDERCGGPDFDYEQELWLIKRSLPLYQHDSRTSCMGYLDPEMVMLWTETYLDITDNPNVPEVNELVDLSILEAIHGPDVRLNCGIGSDN